MKIKILEYKAHQGNLVRVQSHNKHKGKWIPNPNWNFHREVAYETGKYSKGFNPILWKKESSKEV